MSSVNTLIRGTDITLNGNVTYIANQQKRELVYTISKVEAAQMSAGAQFTWRIVLKRYGKNN